MQLIDNEGTNDPHLNLALEEYAVRNLDLEDSAYLLFYVNRPAIIVGKNQNTLEEINHRYVEDEGIHVVRRISGGGTVYHDLGNLNFSFLRRLQTGNLLNFQQFTEPVVRVLRELGVPAELTGRNDIVADGRKISGNAQFTTSNRMFSHGTLLFASELDRVQEALTVKIGKIESKGLKSVRSRVANVSEFLAAPMNLEEFRERLLRGIFGSSEPPLRRLTDAEWQKVHELADSKYRQWDWNYGESPDFNLQKVHRFPIGEIDCRLDVHHGVIESVKVYGDFLGLGEISELERALTGIAYSPDALRGAIERLDLDHYFGGLDHSELVELLY
ncbi:MAG: lipoate--protein ligase [Planctomycetota bacterium]